MKISKFLRIHPTISQIPRFKMEHGAECDLSNELVCHNLIRIMINYCEKIVVLEHYVACD